MGRETRGAAVSAEVQRLLQDALEGEDERLLALERRLGQLQAQRARGAAPTPAPDPAPAPEAPSLRPAPPAAPPLELAEARRLVDESGRYLRELERSIEVLEREEDEAPEPPPPPAGAPLPRARASGSQGRPSDPGRHELGRVFAPGGGGSGVPEGEPAWARALVDAQERTLAALERLEQTLHAGQERLEASVAAARVPAASAEAAPPAELPGPARAVGPRPSEALRARLSQAPQEGVAPVRGALAETVRGAAPPATSARHARTEHGPRRAALLELAGEQQALLATQVRLLERLLALVEG